MTGNPTAPAPTAPGEKRNTPGNGEVPLWRSLVVLLAAALVFGFSHTKSKTAAVAPEAGVVMHMPGYVQCRTGFVGTTAEVSKPERQILPTDTEFARKNYTDYPTGADSIFCGIVLSGATDQSIHRPEACLVGQGWDIVDQEDIPIRLDSGHLLTVKNLTIRRQVTAHGKTFTLTSYNMYWFVGEKVTTPYHYMRMFLSSWDRIVHNRANRWAYVTVSSPITKGLIPNGLDEAQTKALMVDFIKAAVPSFQKSEMPDGGKGETDDDAVLNTNH